jgi:hypothetical protein
MQLFSLRSNGYLDFAELNSAKAALHAMILSVFYNGQTGCL